jgi:hypothetical protein
MSDPVKLLLVEEATLMAMASNPNLVKEFPFLNGLKTAPASPKAGGCGRCSQKASRRISVVNGIKQSLIAMGAEKKQRLKKLLNAEKVKIRVATGGKITEFTF